MKKKTDSLNEWILSIADFIKRGETPPQNYYVSFAQEPNICERLVLLISTIDEKKIDDDDIYYSACIFAIDIFVSQLQMAIDSGNRQAEKTLGLFMICLAQEISRRKHTMSFWMPVINVFYEVHIEISPELRQAYLDLVEQEDIELMPEDTATNSVHNLIEELSDLSVFDITEHLFSQSYAMPADFFSDLVIDLFSAYRGLDIVILSLLHPDAEVRELVVEELDSMLEGFTLSSISLSRLQTIKNWYPPEYQGLISGWIRAQRKKGVVFNVEPNVSKVHLKASEVDGSGAQGIFICIEQQGGHRISSLLFKQGIGIKDAWITPIVPEESVNQYFEEAFDDNLTLRAVDLQYVQTMTNHFLAMMLESGGMPSLHLLEIQELLGVQFTPRKIDVLETVNQLSMEISPFTPEAMKESFARSKKWPKSKLFTESWFLESANVDKIVNRYCSLVDGVKICNLLEAIASVFNDEFEKSRDWWAFHFLWFTLWAKSKSRKNEKLWLDGFFITHAIQNGSLLSEIPIMHEICAQTVVHSMETMQDRRTHLS